MPTYSDQFCADLKQTITLPIDSFKERNHRLLTAWERFYSGRSDEVDKIELAYQVRHVTPDNTMALGGPGSSLEGTACWLSSVALAIAVEFPDVEAVLRRATVVASAHCELPPMGTSYISIDQSTLRFYQNDLHLAELVSKLDLSVQKLARDKSVNDIRTMLGLVCGRTLWEYLVPAAKDYFASYHRDDPKLEFARIFRYLAMSDEGARLAHKYHTLTDTQRLFIEEREDLVLRAIERAR